nr:hypothetical protein [uncultured Janthinobacterium sp.]
MTIAMPSTPAPVAPQRAFFILRPDAGSDYAPLAQKCGTKWRFLVLNQYQCSTALFKYTNAFAMLTGTFADHYS